MTIRTGARRGGGAEAERALRTAAAPRDVAARSRNRGILKGSVPATAVRIRHVGV